MSILVGYCYSTRCFW